MIHTFFSQLNQLLCATICMLSVSLLHSINAQDINYGIKAGSNLTQLRSREPNWSSQKWLARPTIGMYLQAHNEASRVFFQTEMLYSQKGGALTYSQGNNEQKQGVLSPQVGQEIRRSIHFLDIPVTIGMHLFDEKIALYTGSMISYPIYARQTGGMGEDDRWYSTETLNTLLAFQFGLQIKLRKMMRLDIRYERNLGRMGFVLPSGQQVNDQMHNVQVTLQWDLFSDRENVFRF